MTIKTATNVMRRKAGEGRPAPEIGRMTTARAWKLAMPRAAKDILGVQASILRVEESRVVQGDLAGLVPEHGLITLLEGPEERFGIALIDGPTLAGMIEATTTGRVASRQPVPREPTRTDAIISADLLDALLEGFEFSLAEMDEAPNVAGYRYAAPLADAAAMEMTLAEGPYSVFRLTLDLDGGVRQGDIVVAFPVAARGAAQGRDVAAFQKALAENVMSAATELEASLFRVKLSLSEVGELVVGDILKVPLSALAAVEVEAGGKAVATARLGQQGGFRAVRISSLAGRESDEPVGGDFEEAAPAPARAALPPGGFGVGDEANGFPDLGSLSTAAEGDGADLPDIGEPSDAGGVPSLAGAGDTLPDLGDLSPDLPDLPDLPPLDGEEGDEEESGLPDIPGLPPLSG